MLKSWNQCHQLPPISKLLIPGKNNLPFVYPILVYRTCHASLPNTSDNVNVWRLFRLNVIHYM